MEVETTPKLRSVHVPLTDEEWLAAKVRAASSGKTLGEVFADALKSNGSAAPPSR